MIAMWLWKSNYEWRAVNTKLWREGDDGSEHQAGDAALNAKL